MNLIRRVLFRTFRNLNRFNCTISNNTRHVKVLCLEDDNHVKLTFKYSHSRKLFIEIPKEENIQTVLTRIKMRVNLQLKSENIRQSVMNRLSNQVVVQEKEEAVDVYLVKNDTLLNGNISNVEAWMQASHLRIGDILYDVRFNVPTVLSLFLPQYILSDCNIRPRFRLECANWDECSFKWYRSQHREKCMELLNDHNEDEVLIEDDNCWLKVSDGFIYRTCSDDIGCFLKIICTPKRGGHAGNDYFTESVSPVIAVPNQFPFEKRQVYTNSLTDDDSIRCVSYNTLANSYVDKKKFPYCSEKAMDYSYRKQLLFRELEGYNSDILCLQEIEERVFNCDFLPILKDTGLEGCYKKKGGRRYEGLATFFRPSKFRLVQNYAVLLNKIISEDICKDLRTKLGASKKDISVLLKQDSAFQVLLFEHIRNPDRKLIVANTHLYSNKDTPEVRLIQAAVCTNYMEHIIQSQGFQSAAVLFCGDFNSMPSSDTYNFMTSGKCSPNWKNGTNANADTTLLHNLQLESACGTPEYTNYTEEFSGCLDYIFYCKKSLKVSDVTPMPKHEDVIANIGLPSEYFPSDHIALVCTFKWNDS